MNEIQVEELLGLLRSVGHVGVTIGDYGQPHELSWDDIDLGRRLYAELSEQQPTGWKPKEKQDGLDFGDYCLIEQKRYGAPNEMYLYKVIGRARTNYYRAVPVDANDQEPVRLHTMVDVVNVIQCSVREDKVETFRLEDVQPLPTPPNEQDSDIKGDEWDGILGAGND